MDTIVEVQYIRKKLDLCFGSKIEKLYKSGICNILGKMESLKQIKNVLVNKYYYVGANWMYFALICTEWFNNFSEYTKLLQN